MIWLFALPTAYLGVALIVFLCLGNAPDEENQLHYQVVRGIVALLWLPVYWTRGPIVTDRSLTPWWKG